MKEGIRLLLLFSIVSVAWCQWVNQSQYGTLPLQRTDASFVYSATQNKFYLFGGRGTTGLFNSYVALNDMFSFTLETTTWAKITTSGATVSVRWGQSTVLSPDQNSFYIFGGKVDETSNDFYNQTYKYDIVANTWSLINAGTAVPPSRAQHSAVLTAKNTMFIFGGEVYNTTQKFRNDLWKLDLNTNTWTMIQDQGPLSPPPSNRPTPRLGHAVALTSSNIMLVYGGMDYTGLALNQIWAYDLTLGNWTNLTPASSPPARTTPGSAFNFLDNLYVFGGAGSTVFNDFWTYAVSNVWASMSNTNPPSVRISSQMAINSASNTLVLYGGRTTSGWFSDVYTYPVSSFAPIQLYYSVDKTGPSTFVYTFKLVQQASYSGDVDKIVFADAGTGAPANINPLSLASPTSVQSPSGFTSLIAISESGHNGWGYYNGAATGWTPSGIGSSLTWKIQASNFIPHGRLFWSNLDGTGTHANYLLAIYDCREVLAGSLDVDGDGYSPCDYYDPKYFDCNDNMAAVNPAATENCNGYDDNCNGVIDTDVLVFPQLDSQSGVCMGYNKTCQAGSWVSNYTLVVPFYEPIEASCDGKDNDCDSLTDESLTAPAANLTQGVCAGATKVCGGAAGWLEPNYNTIPNYQNPEVSCDLLDNNCDGIMNNIAVLPNATNQLGACKGAKQMCLANGTWVDNFATQVNYSVPEGNKCDSVDNDCDGIVDNNLTPPPGSKNTGVCAGYNKTCVAGVWVDFNYTTLVAYQANETKCNNLDDDCDGLVDEYLTGNLTINQNGVCNGTKQTCQAGTWVNNYTVNPLYEFSETKCNNLDDDCDGIVDNNLPVKNATKTVGVCAGANQTCVNGAWVDANYTAIPYYQVSETFCDTYDNDCDGFTDSFPSNLTTRQGGPCFGMFQKCVNGTGQDDYSSIPYFEYNETLCDGLDNDCDGKNDTFRGTTNTTKQLGVCAGAYKTCKNATWVDDYSYIPGYEPIEQTCDGLDNDCDGQVDEGLTAPLSSNQAGVCFGSRKFCSNTTHNWVDPIWTTIPYYEVTEVTCDSKDNDCDTNVDENLWYVSDNQVGVCEGTQKVCQGGIYSNRYQFYPNGSATHYETNEQSCDGLDNDCDGSIDENLSQLADNQNGVCAGSMKTCAGTAGWQEPDPTTIPGYLPEEVYCDGLDNDCDSKVDNTVSGGCPSNTSSSSGGQESSRGDPVVPGMDFYSNENYNVMGVSMNGTQVVILIFAILGIGVTCLVSCGWAFFSKKKKRPRRAPFPYGVGPDGMPLPPGLMGEEPEIPMEDYSPTPTGSMPDGSFSSRGNVSRGSTNPSLPIIGRQYG